MQCKHLVAGAATFFFALSSAHAGPDFKYDLTAPGSSATINSGLFFQTSTQPTGTGYIDPFLRVESNSSPRKATTQGFNSNLTQGQVQFDEKADPWTHALLLGSLTPIVKNGVSYYEFLLDINQTGSAPLLSVDEIQIYLGTLANPTASKDGNGNFTGFSAGDARLVYDLDAGSKGDSFILLDFTQGNGSGAGDMLMYIPVSLFTAQADATHQFVYLYSMFGKQKQYPNNDGYEEWAATVNGQGVVVVPEPSSAALALLALGAIGLVRLRRRG